MKIDFHTHVFPDTLAERALARLSEKASTPPVLYTNATQSDTESTLRAAGICGAVICNIATNTSQEGRVNDFAISVSRNSFFIPFGSIHPNSTCKEYEMKRLYDAGIRGIKLHPDFAKIPVDDARYDEIFALASELQMIVTVHCGYNPFGKTDLFSSPYAVSRVISKHRNLKLVSAHMGGFGMSEDALRYLVGKDIFIDTSLSALRGFERDALTKILKEHDENRILFGSDAPWSSPELEIGFINSAELGDCVKEKIFYKNAMSLLENVGVGKFFCKSP